MSNFICPECGMTNIDCGRDGYKTPKEIELEKQIERLQEQLKEAVDFILELSEDFDNEGILYPKQRKKLEEIEKWGVK